MNILIPEAEFKRRKRDRLLDYQAYRTRAEDLIRRIPNAGICQAHQCDNTTMDLLFDPAHKRMVGQLLDGCTMRWLGRPNAEEMAALEQRHRERFPATETACKDRQAPAPGSRQGMHRSEPD